MMSRTIVLSQAHLPLQGNRESRREAIGRLPSLKQPASEVSVGVSTRLLYRDCYPSNALGHLCRCRSWPGGTSRTPGCQCRLRHCGPRHPPGKASGVVWCHGFRSCVDPFIPFISLSICPPWFFFFIVVVDTVRRTPGFDPWAAPIYPLYSGCGANSRILWARCAAVRRRYSTLW